MTADPTAVDLDSIRALREAFRAATAPALVDLVGDHEAEFVGPRWLRALSPTGMRLGRMGGWCGKRFESSVEGASSGRAVLQGVNRVRRDGRVQDSIPIGARLEASVLDGRPSLAVTYPPDASFPWPRVRDELRSLGPGVLLGMTFGIPLSPRGGLPFLLRRVPDRG